MKKILKNPYITTSLITISILLIVFIIKGIFPFGNNTLIYGDMYDQITAFFYHFYDSFHGSKSLFIDFTTSGGINFFGIMAYYILSPFSFILLLFKREHIYLAVSIVIALKILLSSLTCLYAIKVLFKEKLSFMLSVVLAISYAFCGYLFLMYQITPWMDAMYLFPLVAVGFKKVLDLEKPYLYIIMLTLSFITSFYVTTISLMFLFFLSFVYIYTNNKDNKRKSITALGISTVIAIGLSMIVIIPAFLQISDSSRISFNFIELLNSKTGPITDKLSFFIPSSFLIVANLLLLLDFKKHKKFLKWYFPSLLILGIPYIVEPVNKIFHFFSYAYFPNRYGYMMFFLLVIGAGYYFSREDKKTTGKKSTLIATTITLLSSVAAIIITYINYERIQDGIYKLTISRDKYLIFALIFLSLSIMVGMTSVIFVKKKSKSYPYIMALLIVHTLCNSFLYLGMDDHQEEMREVYSSMHKLYNMHEKDDNYRIKTNTSSLITNNGMVSHYHNLDHFTSLVNGTNLKFLKQLGYTSHWTKTYSKNGTLFTDFITANKYYLTYNGPIIKDLYTKINKINSYNMYEFNEDISYGYFTENVLFNEKEHSFEFQNKIYKAITNEKQELFKVYDKFKFNNIKVEKEKNRISYKIKDNEAYNSMQIEIPVKEKSLVYLEIFNSFVNTEDLTIYKTMNIYVNDLLYKSSYPITTNNGSLLLGEFDEDLEVEIELLKDIELSYIEVGVVKKDDLLSFIKDEKVDSKVTFNKNKINVEVDSKEEGLFFIPVTYEDSYKVKVNDKESDVIKVYGNYLGVELKDGKNNIEFSYTPSGLELGMLVSTVTLIGTFILFKFSWYEKILNNKLITKTISYIYLLIYILATSLVYVIAFICFILSYFIYLT